MRPKLVEKEMVNILPSVVDPELCFFKMQLERITQNTLELHETVLGLTPEALHVIGVISILVRPFILAVFHTKCFS